MSAPSLHDIAAMPYPASLKAMREYYNPAWGKDRGDGELKTFTVEVEYSIRDQATITVEAFTASEAEDLAAEQVCKRAAGDLGISEYRVECDGTRIKGPTND